MNNTSVQKPTYNTTYYRPWHKDSNRYESYLDYIKDYSLVSYGARVMGSYIEKASEEQVQAIERVRGTIISGMEIVTDRLNNINNKLTFVNQNLYFIAEQQRMSNLLLENIIQLLRVPESEKERQHSIELGVKFFVNAKKDPTLFHDALDELLKAESLMKQDYFVLHRIGCIYLYVEELLNPEKALDYFVRAAKYAIIESDPEALRIANILNEPKDYAVEGNNAQLDKQNISKKLTKEADEKDKEEEEENDGDKLVDSDNDIEILDEEQGDYKDLNSITNTLKKYLRNSRKEFNKQPNVTDISKNNKSSEEIDLEIIHQLSADSYEKAAYASYIVGDDNKAVEYQTKACNLNRTHQNLFFLSKYQARNKQIKEAVENLSAAIDIAPELSIAVFKDLDLLNQTEILNLLEKKNEEINAKKDELIKIFSSVKSDLFVKENALKSDFNNLDYVSKASLITESKNVLKETNKCIVNILVYTNKIIVNLEKRRLISLSKNEILEEIHELKDLPVEHQLKKFKEIANKVRNDIFEIGCKYAGGIVFYIDEIRKTGLVIADKIIGEAQWGNGGDSGTKSEFGSGRENTHKIIQNKFSSSGFLFFKLPIPTAARMCAELDYNGYKDWYLPSIEELKIAALRVNFEDLFNMNCNLFFWSSSQVDSCVGVSNVFGSTLNYALTLKFELKSFREDKSQRGKTSDHLHEDNSRRLSSFTTCAIRSFDFSELLDKQR